MRIHAKAPTRIDLAGGTLDLWPLYLFLEKPTTVNLAIDLFAEAWIEVAPATTPSITLRSEDQKQEMKLSWPELATAQAPPQLELHLKLLRFIASKHDARPEGALTIRTRANSPAGAGLGGSSTLSVALVGAITAWARGGNRADILKEGEDLVDVVRDIETTVIQVPAGVQDYYGAMFGGLQSLHWGAGRHEREWLPEELLPALESRITLFYSGQSRNSGINNWALFKSFIDKQAGVRERFAQINEAARDLEAALRARDWTAAGRAIATEWETRRTLAPGISTPEMDRAFSIAEKLVPSRAGKVCGAGGGGCFFIYTPDPTDKTKVEQALAREFGTGLRALPFRASPRGLTVEVTPSLPTPSPTL
jgi:D-glycero-alpha-D-manno-heptose-7-phosphate kinase